jgi:hypothetical protein
MASSPFSGKLFVQHESTQTINACQDFLFQEKYKRFPCFFAVDGFLKPFNHETHEKTRKKSERFFLVFPCSNPCGNQKNAEWQFHQRRRKTSGNSRETGTAKIVYFYAD